MHRKTIAVVTLASMISLPALAQTAPSSATTPTSPPAAAPALPATGGAFLSTNSRDQMLASDLIGTSVRGSGEEKLGDINDVIIDRSGRTVAVVIGVGGFLGVGEKDVAVPFSQVEIVPVGDADQLTLRRTKEELKAAPEFAARETKAPATTGSVPASTRTAPPAAR